jgi:hypothetical protein
VLLLWKGSAGARRGDPHAEATAMQRRHVLGLDFPLVRGP